MYQETLSVNNKLITERDLFDIFSAMSVEIDKLRKKSLDEYQKNQMYDYNYQVWGLKDFKGTLTFQVEFYDETSIKFDKFSTFMSAFNSRLNEMKYIYVHYAMTYEKKDPTINYTYVNKYINLTITEHKMNIEVSISSHDNNMNEVFELIKDKILNANEKYDKLLRDKDKILNKISLSYGLIPALIICTIAVIFPVVRQFAVKYYVVYPIAVLFFAKLIGPSFIGKTRKLYSTISPDKKYSGYNKDTFENIYKEDINAFINAGEILIGKNVNNLLNRDEIYRTLVSAKKRLVILLVIMILISGLILFI